MIKTYKANTNISINVVLPSNKSLHIAFTPLSNGSSVFSTGNREIQIAIENHYNFGSLFRCIAANATVQGKTAITTGNDNTGDDDRKTIKVSVPDLSSAKDYLADRFGISRTSLRSEKAIMEQAAAHNIEFEGL